MADKAIISTSKLTAIGDAIRAKNGETAKYTPEEMAEKIGEITSSVIDETVTEFNQENSQIQAYFSASSGYTDSDYSTATVMSSYIPSSNSDYSYEKPLGYATTLQAGTLYVVNEETGKAFEAEPVSAGSYTFYNLIPGVTYTWFVKDSTGAIVQGGRLKSTGSLRQYYMPSVHNFRDMGGWTCDGGTTKYGYLLRGAALGSEDATYISTADKQRFRNFGILAEIDLRDLTEVDRNTTDTSDDIDSNEAAGYISYTRYQMSYHKTAMDVTSYSYYKTTVQCLTNIMQNVVNDIPTYFHCAAGADRTGTIAVILEALLGMSPADISRDYELTALVPYYTNRLRTNSSFVAQMDYINTFYGDTFRDKCIMWAHKAGLSIDDINAFRAKMSTGTPETLSYPTTLAITTQPVNVTAKAGETVSESIVAAGDGLTYLWEYRTSSSGTWASIATLGLTATSSSFSISSAQTAMSGYQVRCTVTDKYGDSVISNTVTLTVAEDTYSVTSNLTNCTTSNSATAVTKNSSYSATITANSGYALTSITITMGGTDVTSSVVTGGVISITSVTGNVVITAVTRALTIMEQIGYTDGVRLSTSTGVTKATAGYTTIGYLEKLSGTYTITGIDWSKGQGTNDGIVYYKGSGDSASYIAGSYMSGLCSGDWQGMDASLSDDSLTLTLHIQWSNVGYYIRFSGYGNGVDVVITKS